MCFSHIKWFCGFLRLWESFYCKWVLTHSSHTKLKLNQPTRQVQWVKNYVGLLNIKHSDFLQRIISSYIAWSSSLASRLTNRLLCQLSCWYSEISASSFWFFQCDDFCIYRYDLCCGWIWWKQTSHQHGALRPKYWPVEHAGRHADCQGGSWTCGCQRTYLLFRWKSKVISFCHDSITKVLVCLC